MLHWVFQLLLAAGSLAILWFSLRQFRRLPPSKIVCVRITLREYDLAHLLQAGQLHTADRNVQIRLILHEIDFDTLGDMVHDAKMATPRYGVEMECREVTYYESRRHELPS